MFATAAAHLDKYTEQIRSGALDCSPVMALQAAATPASGSNASSSSRNNKKSSSRKKRSKAESGSSCGTTCECSNSTTPQALTDQLRDLAAAAQQSKQLAAGFDLSCVFWPDLHKSRMLPDGGICVMQHCLSALRFVSACVQQVSSKGLVPSQRLLQLVHAAYGSFEAVAGGNSLPLPEGLDTI